MKVDKEKAIADRYLKNHYNEFFNEIVKTNDTLMENEGRDIFLKYNKSWIRRSKLLTKKFKTFEVDYRSFHAVVCKNLLEQYYGQKFSYSELMKNYSTYPNNTCIKLLCS